MNTLETYLNIYSDSDESKEFHIENIAQNCLNVELNFIPYHLTHSELLTWSEDNCITKEVASIKIKISLGNKTIFVGSFHFIRKR